MIRLSGFSSPSKPKLQITNYLFALPVLNFTFALQLVNLGLVDNLLKSLKI